MSSRSPVVSPFAAPLPILLATLVLAACAPFEQAERPVYREQARCDVAVAEGMAPGKREAEQLAEDGARQQFADSRGYLLASGLKHIRIEGKETRCRPHPIASGFIHCTAQVRLCGR